MSAYDPKEYWSRVATDIGRRAGRNAVAGDDTPFYRYQRSTFVRQFLRTIPVEGRTILEVGCGPGGNLRELLPYHPRGLVGCDISPTMLALASDSSRGLPIAHVETNGTLLPFRDRGFDVVFTVTVLQHNYDDTLIPLVAELCRVAGDRIYLFEGTSAKKEEGYSIVSRTVGEYAELLRVHGFSMVSRGYLRVSVSGRVCNMLTGWLNRHDRKEGEPVTQISWAAELAALPFTRLADRVVPQWSGLTQMVFQRISPR